MHKKIMWALVIRRKKKKSSMRIVEVFLKLNKTLPSLYVSFQL